MKIVISQPMYFPWVGLLEQIKLADVFVHYEDVQFTRGFFNRVQIKTDRGSEWMTVPLKGRHRGQLISEIRLDESKPWREQHRAFLMRTYKNSAHLSEMLMLVDNVFNKRIDNLAELSRASVEELASYFELDCKFANSTGIAGRYTSSQRLLKITQEFGGNVYITGHGALQYLDYDVFDEAGIAVEYMDYKMMPYPQRYGEFTPYVSALDLVAYCGKSGRKYISSQSRHWRQFDKRPK